MSPAGNSNCRQSQRFNPAKAGQFGDTFGAVNALFSGLALTGVAYAVLLQHRELEATQEQLKIAKTDAAESEIARRESDKLQAQQAAALLVAARLNAANAIAQTLGAKRKGIRFLDEIYFIEEIKIYSQYMKILLHSLRIGQSGMAETLGDDRQLYKDFVRAISDEALWELGRIKDGDTDQAHTVLLNFRTEMILMCGQPGFTTQLGLTGLEALFLHVNDLINNYESHKNVNYNKRVYGIIRGFREAD